MDCLKQSAQLKLDKTKQRNQVTLEKLNSVISQQVGEMGELKRNNQLLDIKIGELEKVALLYQG